MMDAADFIITKPGGLTTSESPCKRIADDNNESPSRTRGQEP